jgi:hypothetical protein
MPILPNTPIVVLPADIVFGGSATKTIGAGSCRGFTVVPTDASGQFKVSIGQDEYTFPVGFPWEMNSPSGEKFGNDVLLTCLAGTCIISQIH